MRLNRNLFLCSALLIAMSASAPAADNTRGAVEQSGGNLVPQNPSPPKLHLNDAQRERIRQTLLTKHTEVEFKLFISWAEGYPILRVVALIAAIVVWLIGRTCRSLMA